MQQANNQQRLIETAAQMIAANRPIPEIEYQLMGMGATQQQAYEIITHLRNMQDDGKKAAGRKNILIGAGLLVLGLIITIGTYSAASSSGGGTYVISFGPIIFGVIRLIQGLVQIAG